MVRNRWIPRVLVSLLVLVLLVSFVCPALIPRAVCAETTVGGRITSDTTWTKANSPYIVTESVLVDSGVTLTIQPGVSVKFDSTKAMQIDGQLIARGTEAEPVVFTSNQLTPAPGAWNGILFSGSSVDATYDAGGEHVSGCIMEHCTIQYAQTALRIVGASPFFDHCGISHNSSSGIAVEGGAPAISDCVITQNGSHGIEILWSGERVDAVITDSNISGNSGNGIDVDAFGSVTMTQNDITNNKGGIIAWGHGNLLIKENMIRNNSHPSDHMYAGGGIMLGSKVAANVCGNVIENNYSESGGGGIDIANCYGEITVTHNVIAHNSAGSDCVAAPIPYGTCSKGGGIYFHQGSSFCINTRVVNYNNIYDNSPYDVTYSTAYSGAPHVDCARNWWGTADEDTVKAHIWDWFDNTTLGIVDYSPCLTSPVTDFTAPTTPVVTDDGSSTVNHTQLHATWTSTDNESGIAEYQYAIRTPAEGPDIDVVGWTSSGTNTEVTHTGLSLATGTTYYFAVKAKNGVGAWSEEGKSDGITAQAYTPLAVNFSAQPTECAEGGLVSFTSLCSGGIAPLTYAWDFDNDGSVDSTGQNPTHTYANMGTYTVSLKVTDAEENSDTETKMGFIVITKPPVQETVTDQGGVVETEGGEIAVEFPAGAVTGTATVTIKQIAPPADASIPHGFKAGTTFFTVEAKDAGGNSIVTLSQPLTITVKYSDEDVATASGDPNNLVLAYYDEAVGKWNPLTTTVNTTDKTLSAITTHLSTWATMALAAEGNGVPFWIWITVGVAAVFAVGLGAYLVGKRQVAKQ